MSRVNAAEVQYEEQFVSYEDEMKAETERADILRARTIEILEHPDDTDLEVRMSEEGHFSKFFVDYFTAHGEDGQQGSIIALLAAAQMTALKIAVEELDV